MVIQQILINLAINKVIKIPVVNYKLTTIRQKRRDKKEEEAQLLKLWSQPSPNCDGGGGVPLYDDTLMQCLRQVQNLGFKKRKTEHYPS